MNKMRKSLQGKSGKIFQDEHGYYETSDPTDFVDPVQADGRPLPIIMADGWLRIAMRDEQEKRVIRSYRFKTPEPVEKQPEPLTRTERFMSEILGFIGGR